MKNKLLIPVTVLCISSLISCSQDKIQVENNVIEKPAEKVKTEKQAPHRYGGWYCPDNLFGFPAVDLADWNKVPVVNGRMATKEETQNGTSLIYIDSEKFPDAKPLDMQMPKLARYYCEHSKKDEIIIVIQALNIDNDSVVGFRYLNGGNGSARLNEVRFIDYNEVKNLSTSRFVTLNLNIDATQDEIWEIMTKPEYNKELQPIFDKENSLDPNWRKSSKINYKYSNSGSVTSVLAEKLFGNFYAQIDSESGDFQYVEKFFLLENQETKNTELQLVCGPYSADYENQKFILKNWVQKVKELSEIKSKASPADLKY